MDKTIPWKNDSTQQIMINQNKIGNEEEKNTENRTSIIPKQ